MIAKMDTALLVLVLVRYDGFVTENLFADIFMGQDLSLPGLHLPLLHLLVRGQDLPHQVALVLLVLDPILLIPEVPLAAILLLIFHLWLASMST